MPWVTFNRVEEGLYHAVASDGPEDDLDLRLQFVYLVFEIGIDHRLRSLQILQDGATGLTLLSQ